MPFPWRRRAAVEADSRSVLVDPSPDPELGTSESVDEPAEKPDLQSARPELVEGRVVRQARHERVFGHALSLVPKGVAAMERVVQRLAPFQAAWIRRVERADRWRRRCGLVLPGLGWPGMVHQGWGWYDSLGSICSAAFLAGVALFGFATAMYLLAASAVVTVAREPGARELAIVATPTIEPAVPSPTTAQEPAPPTLQIRPTLVPRVVLPADLPAPQRRAQLPPPRPSPSPVPTAVELTAAPTAQVRTPGPTSAALSPTVPPQTAVRLTPVVLQTPVPTRVPPVASPSARPGAQPTPSAAPPTAALPILTAVRADGGGPAVTFTRPVTRQPTAAQPTAGRPPAQGP